MALRDDWEDLKDATEGVAGSGDDISAEPINKIAQAVIELEENSGNGNNVQIDTEMSDTSENAVQNNVIKAYVDESIRTAILDSWEVPV